MTAVPLAGKVLAMTRYPLKGFPGEALPHSQLKPGQGLPGDRQKAIANGTRSISEDGSWAPCQAFVRMTKNDDLPLYRLEANATEGCLIAPNGTSADLSANCPELENWFGHKGAQLVARSGGQGYWDQADAALSIINSRSVDAVCDAAGVAADVRRFRGNLLFDLREPWLEFELIGKRLRIGTALIEVLRPIDRCKSTSINPETGHADCNMVRTLAAKYGHIFCGVYARVVKGGQISPGMAVEPGGFDVQTVKRGAMPDTAPEVASWPRFMPLKERLPESSDVESFWLEDPFELASRPSPACSYLKIHGHRDGNPITRSYTVSGRVGNRYRLSIKREADRPGLSDLLHKDLAEGDRLLVSGPFRDPALSWKASQNPVLWLTAGIGITVAASIVEELEKASRTPDLIHVHAARDSNSMALWPEMRERIAALGGTSRLNLTRDTPVKCAELGAHPGRPELADCLSGFPILNVQVFLCGPQGFGLSMRQQLKSLGVVDAQIHEDVFVSPSSGHEAPREPERPGPYDVQFESCAETVRWTRQSGTLLDLADENGVAIAANCRAGACGSCLVQVEGEVEHILEPVAPAPRGWCHSCCSVPAGNVTIRA